MQTFSSANEYDCSSPTSVLNSPTQDPYLPVISEINRRTTLGIVQLRSANKKVCVNWSIIPSNAPNKLLKELGESLEQKINESVEQPLEILEDKLFYLCYIFYVDLNGIFPKPQIIEIFHLLNVIQEQSVKTPQMSKALVELSKISEDYMKNYEFLCNFIKLINDLSLIYGVINLYSYRYRFDQSIENIKILNLPSLFSDIINMEIIWLSYSVLKPPLVHIFNNEVKQTAKLLQEEFYKTLQVFMESNKNNLQSKESIQTWLASKNLRLVEDYGFHGKPSKKKPVYQSLTQKMFKCFCFKAAFQAVELKNQLFEFEKIYSHFEAVVLKSLSELEKKMDSPSHWYSIQTELILKSVEGIFEVRLHEKHRFKRAHSTNQNIVLQTMLIESPKIRDEGIDFNFTFPWSLTININLASTQIEQWRFLFSILDKHPNIDVYRQATTSLRAILCLTQILPAYSLFLQGIDLQHSFAGISTTKLDKKFRIILLKSPAGTLFLEVSYLECPDNIANVFQAHVPSVHGSNTPPCIEWNAASLSVSNSSSDLSPPFSPLGNEVENNNPTVLPKYLTKIEENIGVCLKKERKSYDISVVSRECAKISNNFENIVKEIEGNEEVMKEYYSLLFYGNIYD